MLRSLLSTGVVVVFIVSLLVACDKAEKPSAAKPAPTKTEPTQDTPQATAKAGEVLLGVACQQYATSLCQKTKFCLKQARNVSDGIAEMVNETDCKDFGKAGCDHLKNGKRSISQGYLERCLAVMETSSCTDVANPKGLEACRLIEEPLDQTMKNAEEAQPKPAKDIGLGGPNQGMLEPSLVCYSFQKGLCEKYQVCADKLSESYPPEAIEAMKNADCTSFFNDCQEVSFHEAVSMNDLIQCIDSLKQLACDQLEGPNRFDKCQGIVSQLLDVLGKTGK